ncbi:MAG: hypothetical protein ACYS0G_13665 [Planctomycetota bacterium]|jgi:hypothetical protein
MRIWKQDPAIHQLGTRTVYIPGPVDNGPSDAQIRIEAEAHVERDAEGDFLVDDPVTPEFDSVHTFAVVRKVLTMYERSLGRTLGWQWTDDAHGEPLRVHPRAGVAANAFYSRFERALKFFHFTRRALDETEQVFTCRSLDIVSHECGHAILDSLKPGWLNASGAQTGGLHESFGDLTAIATILSQLDLVEFIVAETKADLHRRNILAEIGEEFGLGLGRGTALRNADNDLTLSQVSNQVHSISRVFTGGVYDVLADLFASRRDPSRRNDAAVLYEVGRDLSGLLVRAVIAAPDRNAIFADVADEMIRLARDEGADDLAGFIRRNFELREVLNPPPEVVDLGRLSGDRVGCCATMQRPEYQGEGSCGNA